MQTGDRLCWTKNRAHKFTVKSAYHVALRLQQPNAAEHSRVGIDRMVWKKLWKQNITPKVRMFAWRACLDILPTKVNLACKKIWVDPECTTCTQQDETICHVLWQCRLARNTWALVRGRSKKVASVLRTFSTLQHRWWIDFLSGCWNNGWWYAGRCGMHEIGLNLTNCTPTLLQLSNQPPRFSKCTRD